MKNFVIIMVIILSACSNDNKQNDQTIDVRQVTKFNTDSEYVVVQKYTFDSKLQFQVTGQEGTIIIFQPDSFNDYHGTVQVELIEAYNCFDMIVNHLETRDSSNNLIESKGMFKIIAKDSSDNNLKLKKPMKIKFKDGNINSYNLYLGFEKEGKVNWILDESSRRKENKVYARKLVGYWTDGATNIKTPEYDSVEVRSIEEKEFFESSWFGWLNLDRIYSNNCNRIAVLNVDESLKDFSFITIKENRSLIVFEDKRDSHVVKFLNLSDDLDFYCFGYHILNGKVKVVESALSLAEEQGFNKNDVKEMSVENFSQLINKKMAATKNVSSLK
jgi:hypothetical protein